MTIVFETSRLILRHLEEEDAGFFLELVHDPDWIRFIGDRGLRSVDEARAYLRDKLISSYARFGFGLYCVESKERGLPIGICGLLAREALEDVDLGFAFLPLARGRGYAFEAAAGTMAYARETLGLRRLVALVSPENERSIALLEKLGFGFERPIRLAPALHRVLWLYGTELPAGDQSGRLARS